MYLSELNIWNFRKFGEGSNDTPGLSVQFHKKFNLLIGENDSGKTAIIDAIKLVLSTQSYDYIKIDISDFHKQSTDKDREEQLKIECIFKEFNDKEASHFLEWLNFDNNGDYELRLRLIAKIKGNRVIYDIKGGLEGADIAIDGDARDRLRATYLKPLRDVENELTPGYRSRLAQILKNHEIFQKEKDELGKEIPHELEDIMKKANQELEEYFSVEVPEEPESKYRNGFEIKSKINMYIKEFFHKSETYKTKFNISPAELSDILRKISLSIDDNPSGLGSLNLLYIATELLLLQEENHEGAKLALIEEIEAHLHPQAQLRLVRYLQEQSDQGQFILSTHSANLAASTKLKHLILCQNSNAFPMGHEHTNLEKTDYKFLERFLDATKANLFFARGVILVEGDAENLLLPTIAKIIKRPLHKYGVSIVNVGSTAFIRYSKIFLRKSNPQINIPVAIITDVDIRPLEYYNAQSEGSIFIITKENEEEIRKIPLRIDFEKIRGQVFTSISAFNNAINILKVDRLSSSDREKIHQACKVELSEEVLVQLRKQKKESQIKKYESGNNKVFIAKSWTLEYELSLSSLKKELNKAIIMANSKDVDLTKATELTETQFAEFTGSEKVRAYHLYEPLLKGAVSKAVTAQLFSEIIEQKDEDGELYEVINNDPHLSYLVDAIYYVTEPRVEVESE